MYSLDIIQIKQNRVGFSEYYVLFKYICQMLYILYIFI